MKVADNRFKLSTAYIMLGLLCLFWYFFLTEEGSMRRMYITTDINVALTYDVNTISTLSDGTVYTFTPATYTEDNKKHFYKCVSTNIIIECESIRNEYDQ